MFAVTPRLLLRPGWIEDAPALHAAFADERVIMPLSRAPWPYALSDAEEWLAREKDMRFPSFLVIDRADDARPIIGGVGFDDAEGAPELGYWLTSAKWGQGLMTEATRAALDAVRACLGYRRFVSGHFADNPRSGRVLSKLGFAPTGEVERRMARGRGGEADCVVYALEEAEMAAVTREAMAA